MTIASASTVDAIGVDKATNETVLTIIDHLDWNDLVAHGKLLSEKLNLYFGFIESGEIYESYPEAHGRKLRIDVICRFEPSAVAAQYLEKAGSVASEYGCAFRWRVHAG